MTFYVVFNSISVISGHFLYQNGVLRCFQQYISYIRAFSIAEWRFTLFSILSQLYQDIFYTRMVFYVVFNTISVISVSDFFSIPECRFTLLSKVCQLYHDVFYYRMAFYVVFNSISVISGHFLYQNGVLRCFQQYISYIRAFSIAEWRFTWFSIVSQLYQGFFYTRISFYVVFNSISVISGLFLLLQNSVFRCFQQYLRTFSIPEWRFTWFSIVSLLYQDNFYARMAFQFKLIYFKSIAKQALSLY